MSSTIDGKHITTIEEVTDQLVKAMDRIADALTAIHLITDQLQRHSDDIKLLKKWINPNHKEL